AAIALCWDASSVEASKPDMSPRPALILSLTREFVTLNRWDSAALYRTRDGGFVRAFPMSAFIQNLAVSLDERYLLAASSDGQAMVWEIQSGALVSSVRIPPSDATYNIDASFAGDGKSYV